MKELVLELISTHKREGTKNLMGSCPYLTNAEAASYLRKSPGAMRNLVYRKQVTAYKAGRRLLFKKAELDRWLQKCRVGNSYGY